MITIMIIMNMQNKLCTIWFSHHAMTSLQSVPEQQSQNSELADFANFTELLKKTELPEKFKREVSNSQKREDPISTPGQPPLINWAWRPWCGIFHLTSLGWLPGCAPSQVLHICSLAEPEKLEKSPWFYSNSRKHPCYQQPSHTKSKTQQLLRGKLTLSQGKPRQGLFVVFFFNLLGLWKSLWVTLQIKVMVWQKEITVKQTTYTMEARETHKLVMGV